MTAFLTSQPSHEEEDLISEHEMIQELGTDDSYGRIVNHGNRRRSALKFTTPPPVAARFYQYLRKSHRLRRLFQLLVPSFIQDSETYSRILPLKTHPTAFLDGMRGLAALCVVISHWTGWIYNHRFGWGATGAYYDLVRLPIICILYHGSVQVAIFFVISGYVLSYRPLQYMRSGKTSELHRVLSSLLLRRWARLFLPTAISTLMIVLLLQVGAYEWVRLFHQDKTYMTFRIERHTPRLPTFSAEIWNWVQQQWLVPNEYDWHGSKGLHYDSHLWTIPVEFRCSLYVFLMLLGTSSLKVHFRFALTLIVMAHAWQSGRSEVILFLSGMLIAECDIIRGGAYTAAPSPSTHASVDRKSKNWTVFWAFMSIVALLLLSQPEVECRSTPGWITLCRTIPDLLGQKDIGIWYQRIGAIIWVTSVSRLTFWKRFYESSLIQYFGKISYALYLVHGMANHTVGLLLEMFIFKHVTGVRGGMRDLGFALATCAFFPFTICLADIFWRVAERPSVQFAKWAETKVRVAVN